MLSVMSVQRDALLHQLPRGEPRALQIGPRFVGDHRDVLAFRRADDAERGAVAGGRERAGVAVGHDARAFRDQRGAELAHGAVGGKVFLEDRLASASRSFAFFMRSSAQNRFTAVGRLFARISYASLLPFAQDHPKGRSTADRRRAAHHHVADRLRDLFGAAAGDVDRLVGKQALVEELEAVAAASGSARTSPHQTTRSLPPSTGTCAAVVLANSGAAHLGGELGHVASRPPRSCSRLFFLYCSTVRL